MTLINAFGNSYWPAALNIIKSFYQIILKFSKIAKRQLLTAFRDVGHMTVSLYTLKESTYY